MSWVKLDDQFPEHPKVMAVGPLGLALHVSGICYSSRQLTDGFIPASAVARLTDIKGSVLKKTTARVVAAGLWEESPGGFMVHDYLKYNPSRADVLAKRARDSARNRGGIATDSNRPVPLPDPLPHPRKRIRGIGS